jgi:DNA-directed RNA polymerase subunit RPC12/RpoP
MDRKLTILLGVLIVLGGVWFFKTGRYLFMPPGTDTVLKCSRADCGHEFTNSLPARFDAFPVKCLKCGRKSAFILTSCPNPTADGAMCGAHYALDPKHPARRCPKCGGELPQY